MSLVHRGQLLQVCISDVKHFGLGRGLVRAALAPVARRVPSWVYDGSLFVGGRRDARLRPRLMLALYECLHLNLN